MFRSLRVKRLHIRWRAGVGGDAACAALLSGLLAVITETAARLCLEHAQSNIRATADPEFSGTALRLNLEGIAEVFPAQIILKFISAKES